MFSNINSFISDTYKIKKIVDSCRYMVKPNKYRQIIFLPDDDDDVGGGGCTELVAGDGGIFANCTRFCLIC